MMKNICLGHITVGHLGATYQVLFIFLYKKKKKKNCVDNKYNSTYILLIQCKMHSRKLNHHFYIAAFPDENLNFKIKICLNKIFIRR